MLEELMPLAWKPYADVPPENAEARARAIERRNRENLLRWHETTFGEDVGLTIARAHFAMTGLDHNDGFTREHRA